MKYVMFFGSIGVGKTTTGTKIADLLDASFIAEDLSNNRFLSKFYADMQGYAFKSTVEMLSLMAKNYGKIDKDKQIAILDNGVEELICYNRFMLKNGTLTEDEFSVYYSLYSSLVSTLPKTDLHVYFKCSIQTQLKRISARNRAFEGGIDEQFLQNLNAEYEHYVSSLPKDKLIVIDTENGVDIQKLAKEIKLKLEIN